MKKIRYIFNLLLRLFYPTLFRIENKRTFIELIQNNFKNSIISDKSLINEPSNLHNVTIGDYTYISRNSSISYTKIGKFCSIGPNLICGWGIHPTNGVSTSPMFYSTKLQNGFSLTEDDKIKEREFIHIGNDVFIGMNVTILDGISIGDGAIIGAGSIVSKDIPPYAIAYGNPIAIKKYRFSQEQINSLLKIQWWNFSPENLKDIEKLFFNIDDFIKKHL